MAIYHLSAKTGSRSGGQSAGAKVEYITRRGRYARDGSEVLHVEHAHMPAWAAEEPIEYWRAADLYERANARLFKEIEFALPRELSRADQVTLAREFARHLTEGEQLPYTLAVHAGGGQNPHGHLVISERQNDGRARSAKTWFRRANPKHPELGGARKSESLKPRAWLEQVRASWAEYANRELARVGHRTRIDHRSHRARGIGTIPQIHRGPAADRIHQRKQHSYRRADWARREKSRAAWRQIAHEYRKLKAEREAARAQKPPQIARPSAGAAPGITYHRTRLYSIDLAVSDQHVIALSRGSDRQIAAALYRAARGQGWQSIEVHGTDEIVARIAAMATRDGVEVVAKTPQQQQIVDRIRERELAAARTRVMRLTLRSGIDQRPVLAAIKNEKTARAIRDSSMRILEEQARAAGRARGRRADLPPGIIDEPRDPPPATITRDDLIAQYRKTERGRQWEIKQWGAQNASERAQAARARAEEPGHGWLERRRLRREAQEAEIEAVQAQEAAKEFAPTERDLHALRDDAELARQARRLREIARAAELQEIRHRQIERERAREREREAARERAQARARARAQDHHRGPELSM